MLNDEEFSVDPKPDISSSKKLPKPHRSLHAGREITPRHLKPHRGKKGRINGSGRN